MLTRAICDLCVVDMLLQHVEDVSHLISSDSDDDDGSGGDGGGGGGGGNGSTGGGDDDDSGDFGQSLGTTQEFLLPKPTHANSHDDSAVADTQTGTDDSAAAPALPSALEATSSDGDGGGGDGDGGDSGGGVVARHFNADDVAATAQQEEPTSSSSSLPSGWYMYYDDDGFPYYYNDQTGESLWELPPDVLGGSMEQADTDCAAEGDGPTSAGVATAAAGCRGESSVAEDGATTVGRTTDNGTSSTTTSSSEVSSRVRELEEELRSVRQQLQLQLQLQQQDTTVAAGGDGDGAAVDDGRERRLDDPEVLDWAASYPDIQDALSRCSVRGSDGNGKAVAWVDGTDAAIVACCLCNACASAGPVCVLVYVVMRQVSTHSIVLCRSLLRWVERWRRCW